MQELENLALTYNIDEELYKLYFFLEDLYPNILYFKNNYNNNFNNIKNDVKLYFDEYFRLRDIIYYPYKLNKLNPIRNYQIKNTIPISPFDIPVIKNKNKSYIQIKEIKIKDKKYTVVNNIYLENNSISREIYAHELIHTQINCTGISLINDELLPIFIERLIGNKYQNKYIIYNRIKFLYRDISNLLFTNYNDDEISIYKKIETIKYIESTLKAYYLYLLYINEPLSSTKARIIDDINDIFNNILSIENFIDKYQITPVNYKKLSLFKDSIKK